ncbi:MAG: hypothetical protein KC503_01640 [Myxococcales bacterium]|nr:hypothetical protein [Myxococcales bacterium]
MAVLAGCSSSTPAADTRAGDSTRDSAARDIARADADGAGDDAGVALPRCPQVTPTAPPVALGLDPFYTQHVDAGGIPIVGSAKVPAAAFAQAYYILANILRQRPCIRLALIRARIRVGIIARDEVPTDMPEYSDLNTAFPGTDWNARGRGYGATLLRPLTSGAVENLLGEPGDRWFGELILLHELAHTVFDHGVVVRDDGPAQAATLQALYQAALAKGLWANTYAASTVAEYWAEGVQDFFDDNKQASPPDGIHNHVNTRAELAAYDPDLSAFIGKQLAPPLAAAGCVPDGAIAWQDPTPANPLAASCTFASGYPDDEGCGATAPSASPPPPPTADAELVVVNRSHDQAVELSWLDTNGQAVARGSVPPRNQRTLASAVGQVYQLRRGGACLATYRLRYPQRNIVAAE